MNYLLIMICPYVNENQKVNNLLILLPTSSYSVYPKYLIHFQLNDLLISEDYSKR